MELEHALPSRDQINSELRKELDDLKKQQADLDAKVNGLPKPLTEQQTTDVVQKQIEAARPPRFSLLGANVGSDNVGNVTFTGKGRFFGVLTTAHFALLGLAPLLAWLPELPGLRRALAVSAGVARPRDSSRRRRG